MIDPILFVFGVLVAATFVAAVEYYSQIRKAHQEYEKAKATVEDIILSFGRELRREAAKIDSIEFKFSGNAGRIETILKRVEGFERRMSPVESQLTSISGSSSSFVAKLGDVDAKMRNIEESNEQLRGRITGLEDQLQTLSAAPELKSEMVIPIRREKALGPLTDTEIAVVEMLISEGPKTAPEIKERIHLSREHTARLMKKLYEGGYLERETGKIPFRYTVKKEMEKLLKKTESEQV